MLASTQHSEHRPADARLLAFGWFAAPLAWALHLGVGYALAGWACANGTRWALHILTAVCLLIAAAGIAANAYGGRRAAARHDASAVRQNASVPFLQRSGRLLGLLFVVLIVIESIPVVLAEYCA